MAATTLSCIACSGRLLATRELGIAVLVCESCKGLHSSAPLHPVEASTLVELGRSMQVDCPAPRYFDLMVLRAPLYLTKAELEAGLASYPQDRVHGWFDPATRRVIQYG